LTITLRGVPILKTVIVANVFLLTLTSFSFAVIVETQTDWSGGYGVIGPVSEWGDTFYSSPNVNWSRLSGNIYLSSEPAKAIVRHKIVYNYETPIWLASTDIDGDNDIDIIVANYENNAIEWFENEDSGIYWSSAKGILYDFGGAYGVFPADIDGDNDIDVVGTAITDDEIVWVENVNGDGSLWEKHSITAYYDYPVSLWVASSHTRDEIAWWENEYSGDLWIKHAIDYEITTPVWIRASDIDLDGDNDVAVCNNIIGSPSGYVAWYENEDGLGAIWNKYVVDQPSIAGRRYTNLADFDSDGDLDILAAVANHIIWYENETPSGSYSNWPTNYIKSFYNNICGLHAADVDGDNDPDVISGNNLEAEVVWWANPGGNPGWTDYLVTALFDMPSLLDAADMDNDLDLDIVAGTISNNDICWWEVTTFEGAGQLISSILDAGGPSDWDTFIWTSTNPKNTDVEFFIRSSNDWENMGNWSPPITEPTQDLDDYLQNNDTRYFQYKAQLTSIGAETPVVHAVTVKRYGPVGINDNDFKAISSAEGIIIKWECGDGKVVGFNLYRSTRNRNDGNLTARVKINDDVITGSSPYSFLDRGVSEGASYDFWLEVIYAGDAPETCGPVTCTWTGYLPASFALRQSRPNPARGTTSISFDLPAETDVLINVYDVNGRMVSTLVDSGLPPGSYSAEVSGLAPGVYVYRMKTDEFAAVKKMVIIE
jgi:hypothetical protein